MEIDVNEEFAAGNAGTKALDALSFDSTAVAVFQKALGALAVAGRDILAALG